MPTPLSPRALTTAGLLTAYLLPRMAQDQKINLRPIVQDLDIANFRSQIPTVVRRVKAAVRGRLAMDADVDDLEELLERQNEMSDGDDEPLAEPGSAEECLAAIKNMFSQLDDDAREHVIGELSRMVNEGDFGEDEPPPNGTTSTRNDDGSISSPVKTETPMMLGRGAEDRALRSYATRFPGASRLRVDNTGAASNRADRPAARPAARRSDRLALDAATSGDYAARFPGAGRIKVL
jgi:hypothetical protein